jgi:hypothetical protein
MEGPVNWGQQISKPQKEALAAALFDAMGDNLLALAALAALPLAAESLSTKKRNELWLEARDRLGLGGALGWRVWMGLMDGKKGSEGFNAAWAPASPEERASAWKDKTARDAALDLAARLMEGFDEPFVKITQNASEREKAALGGLKAIEKAPQRARMAVERARWLAAHATLGEAGFSLLEKAGAAVRERLLRGGACVDGDSETLQMVRRAGVWGKWSGGLSRAESAGQEARAAVWLVDSRLLGGMRPNQAGNLLSAFCVEPFVDSLAFSREFGRESGERFAQWLLDEASENEASEAALFFERLAHDSGQMAADEAGADEPDESGEQEEPAKAREGGENGAQSEGAEALADESADAGDEAAARREAKKAAYLQKKAASKKLEKLAMERRAWAPLLQMVMHKNRVGAFWAAVEGAGALASPMARIRLLGAVERGSFRQRVCLPAIWAAKAREAGASAPTPEQAARIAVREAEHWASVWDKMEERAKTAIQRGRDEAEVWALAERQSRPFLTERMRAQQAISRAVFPQKELALLEAMEIAESLETARRLIGSEAGEEGADADGESDELAAGAAGQRSIPASLAAGLECLAGAVETKPAEERRARMRL